MNRNFRVLFFLCIYVFVTNAGRSQSPPTITSFSPLSGPISTTLHIVGTNFDTTTSGNIVRFGAVRAIVTEATSTTLTVTVPVGASYTPISVTANTLSAFSHLPFDVTFTSGGTLDTFSFAPLVRYQAGVFPAAGLTIDDLDDDGKADVAMGNGGEGTISLYRNVSTPGSITTSSLADSIDLTTDVQPFTLAAGDLDGDGKLDIVALDRGFNFGNNFSVFLNTGSAGTISFGAKTDFTTPTNPVSVALSDLDGDGKLDVIVACYGSDSVAVYHNSSTVGTVSLESPIYLTSCASMTGVAAGDLNGDGKPDLAVVNGSCGNFSVYENTSTPGSVSFGTNVDITDPGIPFTLTMGDMNGDGKLDVLVTDYFNNNVTIFENLNSGGAISAASFGSPQNFGVDDQPRSIALGDLNGDGRSDILVTNHESNTASILRNTSTGGSISFAAKVDFTTLQTPFGTAIGDIDGDGRPDFGVANNGDESMSLYRNKLGDIHTLSSSAGAHGSISPSGNTGVLQGGSQAYTIVADTGYFVYDLEVDSVSVGPMSGYTFTNVSSNHAISATFAVDTFTVTATAGAHGTITPSGNVRVTFGSDTTLVITPDGGYGVDSIIVDDVFAGSGSSYTFHGVTSNHTIRVVFEVNTYTITSSAGAHGQIAPSGAIPVTNGNSQVFTMTPDSAFQVADVLVDGGSVGTPSSYTFTNVHASHTISVSFVSYHLAFHPSALAFGNVRVGLTKSDSIMLVASGTGVLPIDSIKADESDFSVTPSAGALAPSESLKLSVVFHPLTTGQKTAHIIIYHSLLPNPDTVQVAGSGFVTMSQAMHGQWNLISLPVAVPDPAKNVLYPTAVSAAFSYRGSYHPNDSLHVGTGYWLKYPAPATVDIDGSTVTNDSVSVSAGWNMIGSLTTPIPVTTIVPIGTVIQSSLFGYDGAYVRADSIFPGLGYWVKVNAPGILVLSSAGPAISPKTGIAAVRESPPGELSSLAISDGAGGKQMLYFGLTTPGTLSTDIFELPPVPPAGSFDARFADQKLVEMVDGHSATSFPISISSGKYPLTLSWSLISGFRSSLMVGNSKVTMSGTGKIQLNDAETPVTLQLEGLAEKPRVFSLEQNYPNPFNPSTTIRFTLPVDARVKLEVYNVLGQSLMISSENAASAGIHSVSFDGANLPGGVYFYRLEAQSLESGAMLFTQVRKMIMVK